MVMNWYCKKCKNIFFLSRDDEKLVNSERKKGIIGTIVVCAFCDNHVAYDLPLPEKTKPSSLIRCPVLFCYGDVMKLEAGEAKKLHKIDTACWACGECGEVWTSRDAMDEQIERMMKKYPHRKKVYQQGKDGHWKAVYPEKNSEKYEEQVSDIETADYDRRQAAMKKANKNDVFRCTRLTCGGYLIPYTAGQLKDFNAKSLPKGKWVCVNCDTSFETREEIEEEIERLVEKYRHRSMAYKKVKESWRPVVMNKKDSLKYSQLLLKIESFDYDALLKARKKSAKKSSTKTPVKKPAKKATKKKS